MKERPQTGAEGAGARGHTLCQGGEGDLASTVMGVLKRRSTQDDLDGTISARPSGHPIRVGAAQDMAAAGIDLGAIMHAGGCKTPAMVMLHIERMDVEKSGMARLYGASSTPRSPAPPR